MQLDIVAVEIYVTFIPTLNADGCTSLGFWNMYREIGAMSNVEEPFLYQTSMLLPEIGRVCLDLGTPNMQGEQYWQTLISVFISSFLMRSSYDHSMIQQHATMSR